MNILVTGHRGYIGPHLVDLLKAAGHHVTGVDIGYFDACNWEPLPPADKEIHGDFCSLTERDLQEFDCICHLAVISNDPMGDLDEKLTYDINRDGSIELARRAKKAAVPRFLFSGSCSVYGKGETLDLNENARFHPVSGIPAKIQSADRPRGFQRQPVCATPFHQEKARGQMTL
jgi:nucleoside-diphosphate-sugar epimerase